MKKHKIIFISFIVSLIYVLIGTLVVLVSFPKYEMAGFDYNHTLWIPLVIITIPVNTLLFGLAMIDNSMFNIIALQLTVFCVFWLFLYKILKRKFPL